MSLDLLDLVQVGQPFGFGADESTPGVAAVYCPFLPPIFASQGIPPMEPYLGETIYLDLPPTSSPTTGGSVDADTLPTVAVYEDNNDTPILAPTVVKRVGATGEYRVAIACTTGNGFEAGRSYNVRALATVESVTARALVATFQMRADSDVLAGVLVEDDVTLVQAVGYLLAATLGVGPGVVPGVATLKNPAGTATRIVAAASGGNRTTVTLTPYEP